MSRYVTVAELRDWLGVGDTLIDAEIQLALDAAEEAIEAFCGRRFWADTTPTSRRYRPPLATPALAIEDTVSVSSVALDEDDDGTYEAAVTDWYLAPQDGDGTRPYRWLVRRNAVWPAGRSVEVTGVHGWPAVPSAVRQATVLQAGRLLKRGREAPFGVAALTLDGGAVMLRSRLDPDVEQLLRPLVRVSP